MHIAFNFHYIHDNPLFVRVLNNIAQKAALPLTLIQDGHDYRIEAAGEQHELEELAELISSLVPQSLFLRDYSMEQCPPSDDPRPLSKISAPYAIPCCPQCQKKVARTLDPFEACDVCGFSESIITFDDVRRFTALDAATPEELFTVLARQLLDEKRLTLLTHNGIRRFSLLQAQEEDLNGILLCDPADISDSFVITQGELDALMMIEKPSVRLRPKLKFRAEHDLAKAFYPVFLADDTITLALSTALSAQGIEAIYCDQVPQLRTASALGYHAIIHVGRDMLPYHHPTALKHPSSCTFESFEAFGDQNGLSLSTSSHDQASRPAIRFLPSNEHSAAANTIAFEPAHAALRSIVLEHDLQGRSLCGIYLSRRHRSQICSFAQKIGYTSMTYFTDESLSHPSQLLSSIARMDEAGARLVANYQRTYPHLIDNIHRARFESEQNLSMLSRLWALAALFIGLSDGEDVNTASEQLEAAALEFNGKSGPRIDYKMIKTPKGYEIDPRLSIRSAMSFKLAGVDEHLLSFGFIDSLADFIAQQAELCDANIAIDGVCLSGDLFENRQLLMRTYNALSANYTVYRNERLSVDGANVAIGAITLGNE